MSILQYKYKAHRLVNTLFYVIVFAIGFVLGFGAKEIDFSKLISNVLMIDTVNAYNIVEKNDFIIDEEKLLDLVYNDYSNFDFTISKNVLCKNTVYDNYDYGELTCLFLDDESVKNLNFSIFRSSSQYYHIDTINDFTNYNENNFLYTYIFNKYDYSYIESSVEISSKTTVIVGNFRQDGTADTYSNFDLPLNGDISQTDLDNFNSIINKLDFNGINLQFNENLFKDNPDFKKVCVDSSKKFAITSTTLSDINSVYDYDYIWFPYGVSGLSKFLYDSSVETKEVHYTEEDAKKNYYFTSKDVIDNYFDSDIPGLELELKDYTDRYSYYGYSAFPFRMYYSDTDYQFNIFWFEEPYKIHMFAGVGAVIPDLKFDNEIENDNEYCFYIKNQYEVTYVNTNEFDDYYGTVPTPNGDLDFETSYMESNMDTGGLMSQVNKFISHIRDTINFINEYVYSLYLSLPVLVRMFLISLSVILIVKFIIGMVVR